MTEYGLFNDEGCVDRGFISVEAAEAALAEQYDVGDELVVKELCPEHEEEPRDSCEECNVEEEEE